MTLELPNPIAAYFAADQAGDPQAVSRCFAADAIVRDEGAAHVGRDAIRDWKARASARFSYRVTPLAMGRDAGRIVVSGQVEGDFPGSPVVLRYGFDLADGEIARLDITP